MKTFEGRITISRVHGDKSSDAPVKICLRDYKSYCNLIEIRMSLDVFAETVLGQGQSECVYEYYETCPVGKIRQNKTVSIKCDRTNRPVGKEIDALLAPYEVDGWSGRREDFESWRQYTDDACNVTFVRWVDDTQAEESK